MTLKHALTRTRGMLPLLFALAIDMLGSGLFTPIALLYFTRVTDLSLGTVGVLASTAALVTLPLPLLVGALVDRFSPRNVVIAAQVMQAVGYSLYLWADDRLSILLVVMLVAAGQRTFWASIFTVVAALPTERDRPDGGKDERFALFGMVQAAATGLGALLTGSLLIAESSTAYQAVALANAATFLLSSLVLLRVPASRGRTDAEKGTARKEKGSRGGYGSLLRDRPYQALIVSNFVLCLCSVWLGVALPVYLVDGLPAPDWLVGPLLAANTVLLATGQGLAVRLVKPLSRVRAMVLAGAAWVVWCLGFALATQLPAGLLVPYLFVVILFYAVAEVVHAPISNALAADAAPEDTRGRYLAVFQYGFTFASIVAPVFFTTLHGVDRTLPWLVLGLLTAVATLGIHTLERRLPQDAVRPREEPSVNAKT
ncbi:MFS transporter [Streptomyces sp. 4N509B]|uniref:MFS transporter n=1 Tax=Streptomyces sp. 4N509B TaxID=3457413 RepID=UPI003FD24757